MEAAGMGLGGRYQGAAGWGVGGAGRQLAWRTFALTYHATLKGSRPLSGLLCEAETGVDFARQIEFIF